MDPLLELDSLKDVVDDFSRNVNFLNNKSRRIFVLLLTMNSLSKDLDVCFVIDWKSVFLNLLSMKVIFKAIVYICFVLDYKFFKQGPRHLFCYR